MSSLTQTYPTHPNAEEALKLVLELAAYPLLKDKYLSGPVKEDVSLDDPVFLDRVFIDGETAWRIVMNDTDDSRRDMSGRLCGARCAKVYRNERFVGLLDLQHAHLCEFFGDHGQAFCRALRKHIMGAV